MSLGPPSTPRSGARLILRTLGGTALYVHRSDEAPRLVLGSGKLFALLTYLALSPARSAERERLLALLWSNMDPKAARNALRVRLSEVRKLGPDLLGPLPDPVVLTASVESDYHALVAAWERHDAGAVVERFTGDFLPAFALPGAKEFEEWADAERTRVRAMFTQAAEGVVREQLSAGHFRDAEALARRVRDLDPSTDVGWRLLLECLIARHDPLVLTVELAAFDRRIAEDTLTVEPATRALVTQARRLVNAPATEVGVTPDAGATPLVAELVGREQEFAAIMQAWTTACAGQVIQVHLVAPAGLGKSRLLADVHARLRAARARVVHVAASYGARDIVYAFASDVAGALGSRRGARGVSREAARVLVALTPSLSATFDVAPDAASGDDALRRRALALRELLAALTEEQPLALLLDDLHWSDPLSQRTLALAFGGLRAGYLLVLSTARHTPDELAAVLRDATMPLAPLSEDAIRELLASLAALPDAPWADALPEALRRATLGSPLLVLEMLALLRERGLLTVTGERWTCDEADRLAAALHEGSALRHRLDRLTVDERRLLLRFAVAGVPLSREHVTAAAAGIDGPGAALTILEQRGLVVRRDEAWSPAHDEHASALLDVASAAERREAAAAAGRALAENAGDDLRRTQLAARLLTWGDDQATLARLFTHLVRRRRLEGDGRSDHALARELLGASATDMRVAALVRALPWPVRARLVSPRRVAAAIALGLALVVLLPLSGAVAVRIAKRPRPRPAVVLLAERPSAERSTVEMFETPLDAEGLASAAPLDIDLSRRPTWRLPDSVLRFAETRSARPDGRGWALARQVADSGVLDLFDVGLDGRLRRLTYTTSDDYWQDWAPDGTQLVFATTRWTRYGRLNLAVYDMATGGVRRLTQADTTSDSAPAWSPDGSRIAFTRARPGSDRSEVCVIDTDRGHERCRQPVSAPQTTVRGWADPHRVLLQGSRDGMATLVRADVDSGNGTAEQVIATGGTEFEASPDGQYALCNCARRGYPAGSWFLFGVDTPDDVKPIRLSEADRREADRRDVRISWAPTSPRRPYLDTLRVALGPGLPTLGTPYQLRTAGVDTAGKAVEFGAVRWRSLDTTVATVDSAGLLRARRAGRVTVEASAGGWRATRATLSVAAPTAARVLLDERWTRGLAPTWRPFGEPRPAIVESDRFGPAFLQNGDGSFASGAYTARAFDTRGALWVEAEQSVPLTTDGPSQEQALLLFAIADSARWARWDHRTGFPPTTQRCELYYPRGPVGPRARGDSLQLRVVVAGRQVAAPHAVQDGRPFRALVQLFPDGRCGFAFDGVPLWVSPPAYFDADTRVMLEGNSQETRVLVGPLRVVSGVAPHVDWRALDTAAASPQPPHGTPAPHRHAAP